MESKEIEKTLSPALDKIEKIGNKKEFPPRKVEDIVSIVETVARKSKQPLSKDEILEHFHNSSGAEKWIIDNIYLVLADALEGKLGHTQQESGEWNPLADLSGVYWTIFGKEKFPDNPVISNLYKVLEIILWKKKEKTVKEVMKEIEEKAIEYNSE